MTGIQLSVGELWEIAGERHVFEQKMGNGFLLFRSERSLAPYQIPLDTGEFATPTTDWLRAQFTSGVVRRLSHPSNASRAQQVAAAREDDFDAILARDPRALVRQVVLNALDRMTGYSKSDHALRRAIASIWEAKPRHLAGKMPPSPSTVRRWLRERGQTGCRMLKVMASMSGKVPRRKQLPASVRRRMHEEALAYWADHSKNISECHDSFAAYLTQLNRYLEARGWACVPVPCRETFRGYVRSLECYETVATKWGIDEAKKRFQAIGEGLMSHRPLLLGAMDHTQMDVHLVMDVRGWRYLGCPTLTWIIDVHSRCIVGWVLSFEPPSIYSVTECIKRANRPKLWLAEIFPDAPELVDIHGKFDEIVVDNGLEFVGTSFESAMTDVGTSLRLAPTRSPCHKAVVERVFGTLNSLLNQRLPGGRFPVQQLRDWNLDPRKDAVLTIEELGELLDHAIGVYHQDLHSFLGEPPVAAWTRGVRAQGGVQVIGDDAQLDKMVGAVVERTLTRSGIALFDLTYHDPAITGPLLEDLAASQPMRKRREGSATATVRVKYNPANIGSVHIWNAKRGIYQTLPCTEPDADGVSKWQHERIQEWVRAEQRETQDERRELRCAFRAKLRSTASLGTAKRIQRAEARLLNSPKIHQIASEHLRLEYAEARHDGMAPVIPTTPLAAERTDGHSKPVRPARRGRKAKPKCVARPDAKMATAPHQWTATGHSDSAWEAF